MAGYMTPEMPARRLTPVSAEHLAEIARQQEQARPTREAIARARQADRITRMARTGELARMMREVPKGA